MLKLELKEREKNEMALSQHESMIIMMQRWVGEQDYEGKSVSRIDYVRIIHGSLNLGEGFERVTLKQTESICLAQSLPTE